MSSREVAKLVHYLWGIAVESTYTQINEFWILVFVSLVIWGGYYQQHRCKIFLMGKVGWLATLPTHPQPLRSAHLSQEAHSTSMVSTSSLRILPPTKCYLLWWASWLLNYWRNYYIEWSATPIHCMWCCRYVLKNCMGWAFAKGRCLNGSSIPMHCHASTHPRSALPVLCFQPAVENVVSC